MNYEENNIIQVNTKCMCIYSDGLGSLWQGLSCIMKDVVAGRYVKALLSHFVFGTKGAK